MRRHSLLTLAAMVIACAAVLGPTLFAHDENAEVGPTKFNSLVPILNVKSVEKSIEYYTTVLGFERHWDWPNDKEDKTFASITNGKIEIFLCENGQGSPGTWIAYNLEDVDALHKELVSRGVPIDTGPVDQTWGTREMYVKDADRNSVRFIQPMEGIE